MQHPRVCSLHHRVADGFIQSSLPSIASPFYNKKHITHHHHIIHTIHTHHTHIHHHRRRSYPPCALAAQQPSNLVTDVLLPTTTITPLTQDLCAALFAAIGAYAWVKLFDALAERRVFDQKLSRKLVHLSAGPLFMLSWVLFSPEPYARYLAALVPCLQALRLIAVGTGWLDSPNTVRAVSRGGDRSELLRGPLYYVLILVAVTSIFWRENPIGVVALSLMCGGDGLADIIGRRFGGNNKLPYNESKSISGSMAMFAGVWGGVYTC